jgi:adenylate kinase
VRVAAKVIVLGRQGAGKGTQCARLASTLGVPHVSTGDLFRAEIASGSPLGEELDGFVRSGALVPDGLVLDVLARRLGDRTARARGYLLDGFPRTLAQGQALFEVLGADAADAAVEIDVPRAVVERRLAARRICRGCGAISVAAADGSASPPCATCGGEVARRDDDTPEAIARRLDLYDEQAAPLLVWLDSLGLLVTVDGDGSPEAVTSRLVAAVTSRLPGIAAPTRTA